MVYRGHVRNGAIVLDDAVSLPEGMEVTVEPVDSKNHRNDPTPLRGTPYRFEDPFTPAAPVEDWNACQ